MSESIIAGSTAPLEAAPERGPSESLAQSGSVRGERNTPSVNSARSLQSRISSVLAAALMIALGVGGLSWYYANALSRQSHARQAAMSAAVNSAQGEMALPPLGGMVTPRTPSGSSQSAGMLQPSAASQPSNASSPDLATDANSELAARGRGTGARPPGTMNLAVPLEPARAMDLTPYTGAIPYSQPSHQAPEDRRLTGAAFTRDSGQPGSTSNGVSGALTGGEGAGIAASRGASLSNAANRGEDSLMTLLKGGIAPAAQAQTLSTQQFLLPKGAFIDCTLETAIDSTLPGMTTCVTATDTFGIDGKVVLLERGSKLVGETRGEVQNGSARVFVLWTEARTPAGVLVPLDSPGTDELGRSGLPGEVNRHFWDRFGAAVLVSVIDGAVQAAAQSTNRGGGALIYNPSTSQDALTEVLKGTINIAPTVTKQQGDRIQILVARDLDFRTVYELRTLGH